MTDIKSMNLTEMAAYFKELGGAGVPSQAGVPVASPGRILF